MLKSFKKYSNIIKMNGFKSFVRIFLSSKMVKLGWIEDAEKQRQRLAREINAEFDSTIAYGPLKGFKFSPQAWWSMHDRASMIFGFYEQEILQALKYLSKSKSTFIDVGAADGYYAIGTVSQKMFEKSYCFEIEERGRAVIKNNAILNNVAEKVTIFKEANMDSMKSIPKQALNSSVVLIDIEGAEFEFLDAEMLKLLKSSVCIIELHDFFFVNGNDMLKDLKSRASEFFNVTEFTTKSRDPSKIPELHNYSDTDRWLMCAEGRTRLMTWLRLDPILIE